MDCPCISMDARLLGGPGSPGNTVCSVQFAVRSVQCAVCSVQCVVCSVQCVVCGVQFSVCSVQWVACSVQCVVCSTCSSCRQEGEGRVVVGVVEVRWGRPGREEGGVAGAARAPS